VAAGVFKPRIKEGITCGRRSIVEPSKLLNS
jgi:hypothetical protein